MKLKKKIEKYLQQNTLLTKKVIFLNNTVNHQTIYLDICINTIKIDILSFIIYTILYNKKVVFHDQTNSFKLNKQIYDKFSEENLNNLNLKYPSSNDFYILDNYNNIINYKHIKLLCIYYPTSLNTTLLEFNKSLYYFFFIPFCIVNNIDCIRDKSDYIITDNSTYNSTLNVIQIVDYTTSDKLNNNLDTLFFSNRLGLFILNNVTSENFIINGDLFSYFSIKNNKLLLMNKLNNDDKSNKSNDDKSNKSNDDKSNKSNNNLELNNIESKNILSVTLPDKYIFINNKLFIYPKLLNQELCNNKIDLFLYYKYIYISDTNNLTIQDLKLYYVNILSSISCLNDNNSKLELNSEKINFTHLFYLQYIDCNHIVLIIHNQLETQIKQILLALFQKNYTTDIIDNYKQIGSNDKYFYKIKFYLNIVTFIVINIIMWFFKQFKKQPEINRNNSNIHFQFTKNEINCLKNYLKSYNLDFSHNFYILLLISIYHTVSNEYCIVFEDNGKIFMFPNICNNIQAYNHILTLKNDKIQKIIQNHCKKKIYFSYINIEDSLSETITIEKVNIYHNPTLQEQEQEYYFYITCTVGNNFLNIDISYSIKEDITIIKKIIDYIFYIIT